MNNVFTRFHRWLPPANLDRFVDYYYFGLSASEDVVSAGPLYGSKAAGLDGLSDCQVNVDFL